MMMRDFYMRDVNTVAPELLGKLLEIGRASCRERV